MEHIGRIQAAVKQEESLLCVFGVLLFYLVKFRKPVSRDLFIRVKADIFFFFFVDDSF